MKKNNELHLFFIIHFLFTIIGMPYFYANYNLLNLISFVSGSFFSAFNVTLLIIVLKALFKKKSVALPVGVIVFKYAVLGIVLYTVAQKEFFNIIYFVVGLSILLPSSLVFSVLYVRKKQIRKGS